MKRLERAYENTMKYFEQSEAVAKEIVGLQFALGDASRGRWCKMFDDIQQLSKYTRIVNFLDTGVPVLPKGEEWLDQEGIVTMALFLTSVPDVLQFRSIRRIPSEEAGKCCAFQTVSYFEVSKNEPYKIKKVRTEGGQYYLMRVLENWDKIYELIKENLAMDLENFGRIHLENMKDKQAELEQKVARLYR